MHISFHGAAQTVTGSKHLIHLDSGKKILLDCGMFQGRGKESAELNNHWGFDPRGLDHVIISHAHIDHIGLLPKLVHDGYRGKIYCTPATASLCKLLLLDSARIQEGDIKYVNRQRNKQNLPPYKALYTEEDARNVFPLLETVAYGEHYLLDKGIELLYTDAGHIIGSAAVHLAIRDSGKTTSITFSGDLGRYQDMILRNPEAFPQADYLILESTYGDQLHDPMSSSNNKLLHHITHTCFEKKGKLIVPAFSLGRTQEILYMLNRMEIDNKLPPVPYYVDGPLSISMTDTVKKYPDLFNAEVQKLLRNDQDVFSFTGLEYVETVEESKSLNNRGEPCVIISSSGMAEAGRVKHHIANNIGQPQNTILMTGYCEPGSLGGRLLARPSEVSIFGKRFSVKAEIAAINSLSAHGDYKDLIQSVAGQDRPKVRELFLVHGEYEVQQNFRGRLLQEGFTKVTIPAMHEECRLSV